MDAEIRTVIHASSILGRRRKRAIVLSPPGAGERPLPVCYYLHGWGGTSESYVNHPRIRAILAGAAQISVFPESFRDWLINDHQGNRYEDYFIEELLPAIEAGLPLAPSRRSVAGFSMGGLSALCLARRYPQLFSGVACFAGAFEAPRRVGDPYQQFRANLDLLMPSEQQHARVWGEPGSAVRQAYDPYNGDLTELRGKRVYLSIGSLDFERMIAMNQRFHQSLIQAGVPHVFEEYAQGHDMELVAESLRSAIQHLNGGFA